MPAPTFYAKSLTELVQLRASKQPDEWAVHTGAAEFGEELVTLTYLDLYKAVDRLAAYYSSLNVPLPCPADQVPPEQVIAVLTSTAVDETLLEIALAKLGLCALLLSINNSVAAVAHLCKQTKSTHLIYGPKYEVTAREAQTLLHDEGIEITLIPEKRFPLWGKGGIRDLKSGSLPSVPARLTPEQEAKRTCVILHSSGSTGFPKPVFITHYGLIANMATSLPKTGFSALPLFHGFGHFSIFRCLYHGKAFTLMPPHLPLTSANICRVIRNSPSPPAQHFAVPYVLKLLGETDEGVEALASFEAVSFAGAAVPDDLGDRLVAAGVNLMSQYGTTETGALMTSRRDFDADKGWNWLRVEGPIKQYMELIPQGSDTFEVVVLDGWPAKILSNREDGAYCTKDLVLQHPEQKNWYKYIGRLDDTLTQTLGEKTNPVPIELAIRGNSPLVQECIVFGDGKPQTGALILPSDAGAELSRDKKAFLQAVWPVIAEANAAAPTHSRILPEMVEVLPYGTDIPVATKLSILRPACYKKFAGIINEIYDRFEKGTGAPKRDINDKGEMEDFLRETILGALGEKAAPGLESNTDLFAYGVDSLQATRVRNVISKSLELGNASLGQNIVYEQASISQLAQYLIDLKAGNTSAKDSSSPEAAHKLMLSLVDKWASKLVKEDLNGYTAPAPPTGEVIVLTGATGSLGAHILDQLTRRSDVATVICLSRAKSHEDSLRRVTDSLQQRRRVLSTEAMKKVVSLAADVNKPDLGLDKDQYEMLRSQSTSIIHNAWPVNFVLSLASFEEHIGGAVNLLNLALKSPRKVKPSFFFSSSVGTVQGRPDPVVHETFSDSPVTAGGMGYGRSKWVVEKVLERAGAETKGRVGVLRIGQLAGDTETGVWNETEAWPLMFRSANTTGHLPILEERLSWLPVDLAGKAIAEIVTSYAQPSRSEPSATVYHVLNAAAAPWSAVLQGLQQGGVDFKAVERREWLKKLAASDNDVQRNPTYKLLSFYQGRIGKDSERAYMDFEIEQTAKVSPTIGKCGPIDAGLVALWANNWKETGFLQ